MFGVLRPPSPPERRPPTPEGAPPLPRSLAPMPPSEFSSREDLLAGTKDWAASQGFAIVIARSRANRLWLKCDRGGNYENRRNLTQDQRKRKRGESRLLGCPFRMIATIKKDGTWRVETDTPEHNHGPSEDLSMHPTLRRMNEAQLAKVHQMFDVGRSPAETVEELKATWPDIKVLTRDIYNARKKYKTQREEAEAVGAIGRGSAPDPNGVFPGPDQNGRWAWVPDGEEVTSKTSRRRKKTTLPSTSPSADVIDETLDPQLQNPNPIHLLQRAVDESLAIDTHNHYPTSGHGSTPYRSRSHNPPGASSEDPDPHHGMDGSSDSPGPSPSHVHSQRTPRSQTPATAATRSSPPAGPNTVDSPVVLAARIERMEKEQRDQKNMLAQILGAVKGISGSPPI